MLKLIRKFKICFAVFFFLFSFVSVQSCNDEEDLTAEKTFHIRFEKNVDNSKDVVGVMSEFLVKESDFKKSDGKINLPVSVFVRVGYGFIGWNTVSDGTGTYFADKAGLSVDQMPSDSDTLVLYAQWSLKDLTLTVGADSAQISSGWLKNPETTPYQFKIIINRGTENESEIDLGNGETTVVKYGDKIRIEFRNVFDEDLINPGYKYNGWYIGDNKNPYGNATPNLLDNYTIENNELRIVYKVKPIEYSVCFEPNGGSGSFESQGPVKYGESINLPEPEGENLLYNGYVFAGWKFDPDGETADFPYDLSMSGNYTAKNITYDEVETPVVLYAHWKAAENELLFNYEEGRKVFENIENIPNKLLESEIIKTGISSKTVVYSGVYGDLPLPESKGWQFDGWFTESDGGERVFSDTVCELTSGQTLYAHWTPKTHVLTVRKGDNSAKMGAINVSNTAGNIDSDVANVMKYSCYYGQNIIMELSSVSLGYEIGGWVKTNGNSTKSGVMSAELEMPDSDEEVIVHVKPTTATLKFVYTKSGGPTINVDNDSPSFPIPIGDVPVPEKVTLQFEKEYELPKLATTVGYTHGGWTFSKNIKGNYVPIQMEGVTGPLKAIKSSQTTPWFTESGEVLYAIASWIPNTYTIWFNVNKTEGSNNSLTSSEPLLSTTEKKVNYYEEIGSLPEPTREGWTFDGWWTESNGGESVSSVTVFKLDSDRTLYAHWLESDYSLQVIKDDHILQVSGCENPVHYGQNVTLNVSETDDGYEFSHWTFENGSISYEPVINVTMPSSGLTLWVSAKPKTIKVSFCANQSVGDTDMMSDSVPVITGSSEKQVVFGNKYGELPSAERKGWSFTGWFDESENKITKDSVVNIYYNHVLTAKWEPQYYNLAISHDGNADIQIEAESSSFLYGQEVTVRVVSFKPGFCFNRWDVVSTSEFEILKQDSSMISIVMPSSEVSITLICKPVTLSVFFIGNKTVGSTNKLSQSEPRFDGQNSKYVIYAEKYEELPIPARKGWSFTGWHDSEGNPVDKNTVVSATGDHNLYAGWEPVHYELKITYDAHIGKVSTNSVQNSAVYGESVTLSAENFEPGYSFDRWNVSDEIEVNNESDSIEFEMPACSLNITAVSKPNKAILTFVYTKEDGSINYEGAVSEPVIASGSVMPENNKLELTYGKTYSLPFLTAEGYSFSGWIIKNPDRVYNYEPMNFPITGSITANIRMPWFNGGEELTATAKWSADTVSTAFFIIGDKNGFALIDGKSTTSKPVLTLGEFPENYSVELKTDSSLSLPVLSADGLTFLGWIVESYKDSTDPIKREFISVTDSPVEITVPRSVSGEILNITANWEQNHYNALLITNEGNDGSTEALRESMAVLEQSQHEIIFNEPFKNLPVPEREGWIFEGWWTDPEEGEVVNEEIIHTVASDVNLYAHWKEADYRIIFIKGSNPKKIAVCSNTTAQFGSTISISADFADGYKIDYWDSNGTISDIHEPETLLTVPSHDVYVTINAVPISYEVIFDPAGGDGEMSPLTLLYDQEKNLTLNSFTRTGYSFVCWNTDSDGTGERYNDGQEVLNLSDDDGSVVTLFACWKTNEYRIRFDYQQESGSTEALRQAMMSGNEVEEIVLSYNSVFGDLPSPEIPGRVFSGWYTEDGNQKITSESVMDFTSDLVLYAHWDENIYRLIIENNEHVSEISGSSFTGVFGTELTVEVVSVDRGYEFDRWISETDGMVVDNPESRSITVIMPDSDVLLRIGLKFAEYTIRFNLNKSIGPTDRLTGSTPVISGAYEKKVSYGVLYGELPVPKRQGWHFAGWHLSQEADSELINSSTVVSKFDSHYLYAHWEPELYNLTVSAGDFVQTVTGSSDSVLFGDVKYVSAREFDDGYTFSHWSVIPSDPSVEIGGIIDDVYSREIRIEMPYCSVELIANAKVDFITVTFNLNKTTFNIESEKLNNSEPQFAEEQSFTKDILYTGNYGNLPVPSRKGWSFTGWYFTSACDSNQKISEQTNVMKPYDHDIYAGWAPNMYHLQVKVGNYVTAVSGTTYSAVYGQKCDIGAESIQEGYVFDCWRSTTEGLTIFDENKTHTYIEMPDCDAEVTAYARSSYSKVRFIALKTDGPNNYLSDSEPEFTSEVREFRFGSTYDELPVPVRKGWDFVGWYYGDNLIKEDSVVDFFGIIEFYAEWTPHNYSLSVEIGDDYVLNTSGSTETAVFGQDILVKAENFQLGYDFDYWVSNNDELVISDIKSAVTTIRMPASDVILTAYAKVKNISVTFNLNKTEGVNSSLSSSEPYSSVTSKTVVYGEEYGDLPIPERMGWHFNGWYDSEEEGNEIFNTTVVNKNDNHSLYAYWEPECYSLTINCGQYVTGVTGSKDNVFYGEEVEIQAVSFEGEFVFLSWNYIVLNESRISGFYISDINSATATVRMPASDVVITANAGVSPVRVSFNLNQTDGPNSELTDSIPELNDDTEVKITRIGSTYGSLPIPKRKGWVFKGWFYDPVLEDEGVVTFDTLVIYDTDHSLYAHWSPAEFELSIEKDNHIEAVSISSDSTYYYFGGVVTISIDKITEGYIFDSWTTSNPDCVISDPYSITTEVKIPASNTVVCAHSKAATILVTFSLNKTDGPNDYLSLSEPEFVSGNTEKSVDYLSSYGVLPVPSRPGWIFKGWFPDINYDSESERIKSDTIVSNTSDHTLYAGWSPEKYILKVKSGDRVLQVSGGVDLPKYVYGQEICVSADLFVQGYCFDKWLCDDDNVINNIADINSGETVILMPASNVEITATAKPVQVVMDFIYKRDGVNINSDNSTVEPVGDMPEEDYVVLTYDLPYILPVLTAEGYTFKGWLISNSIVEYTEGMFSNNDYLTPKTGTIASSSETPWFTGLEGETLTATAQWEPIHYYILFDGNETVGITSLLTKQTVNLDQLYKEVVFNSPYGQLPEPERFGWDFNGWFIKYTYNDDPEQIEHYMTITSDTIVFYPETHTLFAQWTPTSYNWEIRLSENPEDYPDKILNYYGKTDSAGTGISGTAILGQSVSISSEFMPGYRISQWKSDVVGSFQSGGYFVDSKSAQTEFIMPASDSVVIITLCAEPEEYTVTLDGNKTQGSNTMLSMSDVVLNSSTEFVVTYNNDYPEIQAPERIGWEFAGWWTEPDGGQEIDIESKVNITEDTVLYAHWVETEYDLNFVKGSNSERIILLPEDRKAKYGEEIELIVSLDDSFEVESWSPRYPNFGITKTDYNRAVFVMGNNSNTIVIHATHKAELKVTLDANKTQGSTDLLTASEVNLNQNSFYVSPNGTYGNLPEPTRTGWQFVGWYDSPSGGESISSDSNIIQNSDHTLYAHWEIVNYNLNINTEELEDSSYSELSFEPTAVYGQEVTVSITVSEGYLFVEWQGNVEFDDPDSTTVRFIMPSENVTITPVINKIIMVTVKFDVNNCEGDSEELTNSTAVPMNDYTVAYKSNFGTKVSEKKAPSRIGWEFAGWWTEPSGGVRIRENTKVEVTDEITLYAHWKVKKYKLKIAKGYGSDGILSVSGATTSAYYGQFVPLSAILESDYLMSGWEADWDDENNTNNFDNDKSSSTFYHMPPSDVVITVNATPNFTIVSFTGNQTKGSTWMLSNSSVYVDTPSKKYPFNSVLGELPVPVRKGWVFKGWSYDGTEKSIVKPEDSVSPWDMHLTAVWEEKLIDVQIDFEAECGEYDYIYLNVSHNDYEEETVRVVNEEYVFDYDDYDYERNMVTGTINIQAKLGETISVATMNWYEEPQDAPETEFDSFTGYGVSVRENPDSTGTCRFTVVDEVNPADDGNPRLVISWRGR